MVESITVISWRVDQGLAKIIKANKLYQKKIKAGFKYFLKIVKKIKCTIIKVEINLLMVIQ